MAIDKIVAEYRLELDGLRQDVNALKGQLKSVDDSVNTSANNTKSKLDDIGNQVTGKLTDSFKKLGGAIVAAFAVEKIGAFISRSIDLAAQMDSVKRSFDKLNDPTLLRSLQQAVNGTVGDIELMQAALRANNFKIPLQDLTNMFKFAKIQSDLTGRSVTELANTIIDSIGKGSVRALNELGVKQEEINAAVVETGSVYAGSMKIINDGLALASEQTETFSDKQAQLRVQLERTQTELGEKFLPVLAGFLDGLNYSLDQLMGLMDKHHKTQNQLSEESLEIARERDRIIGEQTDAYKKSNDEAVAFFQQLIDNLGTSNSALTAAQSSAFDFIDGQLKSLSQRTDDFSKATVFGYQKAKQSISEFVKEHWEVPKPIKDTGDEAENATPKVWVLGQALLTLAQHALDASDAMGGDKGGATGSARAAFGVARTEAEKLREELEKLSTVTKDGLPNATKEGLTTSLEEWSNYFNAISGLASGFNELSNSLSENRIAQLESELDKGLISQEQYDDKLKEIQKEQAKRDKAFRVFQAIIGTAQSIINAATSTPFNPALIALAAATGIAQTAAIVSAPLPKFKDGVIDLKGKGTETSDSNLALLSKGESVITAKATRKHKDALEAIQKDRFDEYVMQIYAKQIKDKQKDTAIGWDEYFYRQYLLQNKLISATEKQGDKVIEAVREMPKRHRFQ